MRVSFHFICIIGAFLLFQISFCEGFFHREKALQAPVSRRRRNKNLAGRKYDNRGRTAAIDDDREFAEGRAEITRSILASALIVYFTHLFLPYTNHPKNESSLILIEVITFLLVWRVHGMNNPNAFAKFIFLCGLLSSSIIWLDLAIGCGISLTSIGRSIAEEHGESIRDYCRFDMSIDRVITLCSLATLRVLFGSIVLFPPTKGKGDK